MLRIIKEIGPNWVLGENVLGIVSMELDVVLSDLEGEGYTTQAFVIPACAVDAPHRRERVWIVANTSNARIENMCERENGILANPASRGFKKSHATRARKSVPSFGGETLAYSPGCGWRQRDQDSRGHGERTAEKEKRCRPSNRCKWPPEPGVGRVAHGVPRRVDRLRGLGNAIVPQVAYQIMQTINIIAKGDK